MHFKALAVGAAIFAGAAFAPELAAAAALPGAQGPQSAIETGTLVQEVRRRGRGHHGHAHRGHRHHGRHHRHHRHFGHRHFRHRPYYDYGYDRYYRCTRVHHACARDWGWSSDEFYRCIRHRGC